MNLRLKWGAASESPVARGRPPSWTEASDEGGRRGNAKTK